jgi:hypothetical protein
VDDRAPTIENRARIGIVDADAVNKQCTRAVHDARRRQILDWRLSLGSDRNAACAQAVGEGSVTVAHHRIFCRTLGDMHRHGKRVFAREVRDTCEERRRHRVGCVG